MMDSGSSGSGGGGIGEGGTGYSSSNGHSQPAADNNSGTTNSNNSTATSPTSERDTSVNRNDGDRRFPFNLDFDSGRRQMQSLAMFSQWARNNVNLAIPSLGSLSSYDGEQSISERLGLPRRTQNSTHIVMPSSSGQAGANDGEPSSSEPLRLARRTQTGTHIQAGASGGTSSPNVSGASLSRSSPSHLRRNSVEDTVETGNGGYSGAGSTVNRDSIVLVIESGTNSWEESELNERRRSGDGTTGNHPPRPDTPIPGDANDLPMPEDPAGTPNYQPPERSTADMLRDTADSRAILNEINRYTTVRPFIIIMLLKGLMDHGSGIICFLAMLVTLSHANSLLKKEVSKQRKRNLLYLAMITINLVVCAVFIYYVFNDDELYYALIFMPTKVELTSFWALLWVVGVSDFVGKFASVVAKAFIVGLPASVLAFQKRGKYYLFIEQTTQLYRSFLPVHHWLIYLVNSYDGATKMFGIFLAGMYCIFKAADSVQRVKDWNTAFQKLLQNVHYGTAPTAKELDSVGTTCPICHDTFTCPTRLSCTHIFCEECVSTWFDRERTCPMCRSKVVDDPTFRDGSTSQYIQFF